MKEWVEEGVTRDGMGREDAGMGQEAPYPITPDGYKQPYLAWEWRGVRGGEGDGVRGKIEGRDKMERINWQDQINHVFSFLAAAAVAMAIEAAPMVVVVMVVVIMTWLQFQKSTYGLEAIRMTPSALVWSISGLTPDFMMYLPLLDTFAAINVSYKKTKCKYYKTGITKNSDVWHK